MRRFLLITLMLLAVLAAVLGGTAWYLLHDEDFLKARLSAFVLDRTGRTLTVDGPLSIKPGRLTAIEAEGIRFANATWAEPADMVRVARLRLVVDIPSLFGDRTVIPRLSIEDCSLTLIEGEDGVANWDVLPAKTDTDEAPTGGRFPLLLLDTEVRGCSLTHAAPGRALPLRVEVDALTQQLREDQHWQVQGGGRVGDDPFSVDGWLAPASALVLGGPLEHSLEITVGLTTLQSSGTLQDAATGQGANIEARLHGPEIANVLAYLRLPPLSSGLFDVALSLNTEGPLTRLSLDGNLGRLQARAEGELDRLVSPSQGRVSGKVEGPDLALLGQAFGIEGLASAPYALDADLRFEPGRVKFEHFELETPADRLSVRGVLGTGGGHAGTDLDVALQGAEAGHWAALFGRPGLELGAATLTGRLLGDPNGLGSVRARLEHGETTLTVDGTLGDLSRPLQPELAVDLHSDDIGAVSQRLGGPVLPSAPISFRGRVSRPAELLILEGVEVTLGSHGGTLAGQVNPVAPFTGSALQIELRSPNAADLGALFQRAQWPAAPLTLTGRVGRPDQRIRLDGVELDLGGHRAHLDGVLNPDDWFTGSEFEVRLDTPDVAALAALFGTAGLPSQPMNLRGVVQPEGKGLRFRTEQASIGDIRLDVDGLIVDLDKPLGIDARFDVRLPSLTLLDFLAPDSELPDWPVTARGALHSEPDRTRLEDVQLTLGDLRVQVSGDLHPDKRYELAIEASGPDASQLPQWLGRPLAPQPFSLRTRLAGDPGAVDLADIDARLGESRGAGKLRIELGTPRKIEGRLDFSYLDLGPWIAADSQGPEAATASSSPYVFDDRKVMWIEDYGVEIDLDLDVAELNLGNTRLFDLVLGIRLGPHRLELAPFAFRGARGGTFEGSATLDDSGAKPALDVVMNGEDLRLGLTAAPGQDPGTIPPLELHVVLHGSGITRREMANSLDGKVRMFSGAGQVASAGMDFLFSDFLTELFNALNPLAATSEYTQLDCSVWGADIVAGQVKADPVVIHMEQFTILSSGTIDLRTERLDLSFRTKPRKGLGITPGTVINTLIRVGGSLRQPAIELDPAGAIVSGGTAIATAGLSIVAKSFSDRFLSSKDPCGDARKELAKRDR
jgi:uncharacterized protein involved in outer membrane biogenesis